MSDLPDALDSETVVTIEAVVYDRYPELVQPYLDAVAAARRVVAGQPILECTEHHQLTFGTKPCRYGMDGGTECVFVDRLLVEP